MSDIGGAPGTARWFLNLQVTFGLAGGAIWLAGTLFNQEFVSGVGGGLILAALLLRMGRVKAEDEEWADPADAADPAADGDGDPPTL